MPNNFSIKPSDIPSRGGARENTSKPAPFKLMASAPVSPGRWQDWLPFQGIANKDIVFFTREFSILLNASVPIIESLKILAKQTKSEHLQNVIQAMIVDIESGDSLSASLIRHPRVFNNLFVNLVRAGELSGTLDKSLTYIADQYEKDYNLRRKIKSALTYPAFVIGAMGLVLALLFTYVMPKMLAMLQETGANLPITTRILIFITIVFLHYWWLFLLLLIGLVVAFRYFVNKPAGRVRWDGYKIKFPIIGPILQKVYVERFSRNFSVLVQGGVPIVSGLKVTADAISNTAYQKILYEVAEQVENGRTLADALSDYPAEIPILVTQMVDVGERTSKTDEILGKIASFYERESESSVATLTQLLEPIVMLILGLLVALIVSGILLPIYNLVAAQ